MKKTFRSSQMKDVIGPRLHWRSMHLYGLPFRNAGGHIFPDDEDLVDLMLIAVEKHPELHIVTCLDENGGYMTLNRYEPENAEAYYLHSGDSDPEIEFTDEVSLHDWTDEEIEEGQRRFERARNHKFTVVEMAALNFSIQAKIDKDRSRG